MEVLNSLYTLERQQAVTARVRQKNEDIRRQLQSLTTNKIKSALRDEQKLVAQLQQENEKLHSMIRDFSNEHVTAANDGIITAVDLIDENDVESGITVAENRGEQILDTAFNANTEEIEHENEATKNTIPIDSASANLQVVSNDLPKENVHSVENSIEARCEQCNRIIRGKKKYLRSNIRRHMERMHSKWAQFKCPLCNRKTSYDALRAHINHFKTSEIIKNAANEHTDLTAEQHSVLRKALIEERKECIREEIDGHRMVRHINRKLHDLASKMLYGKHDDRN